MFKLKFYNKAVVCFMSVMALLVVGCGSDCENCVAAFEASWFDARDGRTYKVVTIGSQTWMAENLNYEMPNSACFKNDPSKCEQYGRLYSWEAAMQACAEGWHLPSLEEWKILIDAVGGDEMAGSVLKAKTGWLNNGNGSDIYGFSVLPAGYGFGKFEGEGDDAYFWSSYVNVERDRVGSMGFDDDHDNVYWYHYDYKSDGYSVRCLLN